MAKVDILLATYNGEAYISSQILSILSQSFRDWRLLVHDDGSTDRTVELVKYWQTVDSRIVLIEDGIKFGNAAANFLYLVKCASAEYIMFCDQDDIWFDNKVERMERAIARRNHEIPQVVYSNAYVWKPDTEGIVGLATLTFPQTLRQLLFLNSGMQGCVAIFNWKMQEMLGRWKGECAMHDHLLHLIGLSLGEVEYLPLPLMLYRQHDHNVTGETAVCVYNWKRLCAHRRLPVVDKRHYKGVRSFYCQFKELLEADKCLLLKKYIELPSENFCKRCIDIFFHRFQLYDSVLKLLLKVILRPYI